MPATPVAGILAELSDARYSALDLLAESSVEESLVALLLGERAQTASPELLAQFGRFREQMERTDCSGVKVVVFGGGTGLATIVGGDSRRENWPERPFTGLKQYFADLHSVVCVTDDGGSTGELRKLLPLVGLGDLRHVLLAAIRRDALIRTYGLSESGAGQLALALHGLFNHRFETPPESAEALLAAAAPRAQLLPGPMREFFLPLVHALFDDPRLRPALDLPQCLGNLLLAAAIYTYLDPRAPAPDPAALDRALCGGLADMARALGLEDDAVLPAALAPAELALLYSNGVRVTSEDKSGAARRGYPVDRVLTAFCAGRREATLHPRLPALVAEADILLFAPGSLYTSIVPILQTPGIAEAIRANTRALKLLVANIWVQMGETDAARDAPERKFYVSDMIRAWRRNIPGGVEGLFSHVIALNMADIPASVLQGYALEDKEPIYIDRERVQELGFGLIEAAVFSRDLLLRRRRLQHDPDALARTVKTLWLLRCLGLMNGPETPAPPPETPPPAIPPPPRRPLPCLRYAALRERLAAWDWGRIATPEAAESETAAPLADSERRFLLDRIQKILWRHPDIIPEHLAAPRRFCLVDAALWKQAQDWDNIASTYLPETRGLLIREDLIREPRRLEAAFLVALGQSLLGNYVAEKSMEPLLFQGAPVGLLYRLRLRAAGLDSFLAHADLGRYLELTRMRPAPADPDVYTRAVNLGEGFTPPGLFFGLFYAWYLDNGLAPNIEYKMAIMRHARSAMIPEQWRMSRRRGDTIDFFRDKVFGAGGRQEEAPPCPTP